ncbi:hypothetical protein ACFL1H_04440 [Nanoarchaeota archaeon]
MIHNFTKHFTEKKFDYIKIKNKYFEKDERLMSVVNAIKDRSKRSDFPLAIGKFLGHMNGKKFVPSSILLDKLASKSKRKVVINSDGEWLYICGRDIFKDNIQKLQTKEGLVLVQNENDENLGLGKVTKESKSKIAIKNLLDKGDFLRRER